MESGAVEVVNREVELTEPELRQGLNDSPSILLVDPHPGVEVSCGPRESVRSQCVPTNHQEPNVMSGEQLDKLFEVRIEMHRCLQRLVAA
jgi:hypothetical protein